MSAQQLETECYTRDDLEGFLDGFLNCVLFFEPLPPADIDEDEDWEDGSSYSDGGPFDVSDLTPDSRLLVRSLCRHFLDKGWGLIQENCIDPYGGDNISQAGHDFAACLQGYGEDFIGRWLEPAASQLQAIASFYSWLELEPVGGKIRIFGHEKVAARREALRLQKNRI